MGCGILSFNYLSLWVLSDVLVILSGRIPCRCIRRERVPAGGAVVALHGNVVAARSDTVPDIIDSLRPASGSTDNGEVPFHAGSLSIRERPALPCLWVEAHGYDIAV